MSRSSLVNAPVQIDTGRLRLTPPRRNDAADIFERYASDPAVTRYLGWARHRTMADTAAFLDVSDAQWQADGVGPYLIRAKDDERLLGTTGLALEPGAGAMTGYVFAKDAWGKGYATEALTAMVALARNLQLSRLHAFCHADHRPSWHVLEKCGFTRDARWTKHTQFPNLGSDAPQPVLRYVLRIPTQAPAN
jgi:RimJ/RimL family protein N-acetyltransferase